MKGLKGFAILLSVFLMLLLNNCSLAQNLFFIKDSLTLNSGFELYVKGGIKLEGNAVLQNNGIIYIKTDSAFGGENWTNNVSPDFMSGTGKVTFMSAEQQLVSGTDTSKFFDLEIANTSTNGIVLEKSIIVQNSLFLFDGIINTDTNKVIITNTDSASISGYQQGAITSSFINGNLRRYVNTLNNSYGFPVGRNEIYYLQEIKINSISGIINYFDSRFDSLVNHIDVDLSVTEDGKPYYSVCNEGVWYLTPNQQPGSITYDCWSYIGNFTTCNLMDNHFAILKRPDTSLTAADWDCNNCGIGFGLNPDNGDGRLIFDGYALRKNLNSFSQFGIGKMICSININLGNDTVLCYGETLTLSADSGLIYLWNNGSSNQTIIVDTAGNYNVTISDTLGCIGYDTINVIILPEYLINNNLSICNGDSIFLGGLWQNSSDTYYDTLFSVLSCDSIISTVLNVNPTYIINEYQSICEGDSIFLGGMWQSLTGIYNDSMFTVYSCDSILITDLTVNSLPIIIISQDTTIELGSSCVLEAEGGILYLWSNGDNTSNITVSPQQNTIYVVSVTNTYGCTNKDSVLVNVIEIVELFIPNAITPNGDGKNDCFYIRGLENFPENQLIIYNRWGNKIFESISYQNNWYGESQITGEILPNGTYYYILKLNDENNNTHTGYIELVK